MEASKFIDFSKAVSIIDSEKYTNFREKYGCLTSETQINFLCNLILNYKLNNTSNIKNVVEIGTNLGLTTYFMLEAGTKKYSNDFKLTSFELNDSEQMGKIVHENATENEKESFIFKKGITFSDYCTHGVNIFEKNKIDLVFIDGQHTHPGPLIDVLFILPFMKKGGLLVFHDINDRYDPEDWGACYVYEGLNVKKVSLEEDIIGYVVVPNEINSLYKDLLHIAKQPFKACLWQQDKSHCIAEREIPNLENFLFKHYSKDFSTELISIIKNNVEKYNEINLDLAKRSDAMKYMFFKIIELEERINKLNQELESTRFDSLQTKYINKKILIYGAGLNTKRLMNKFDFSKLNIVGISDKKFENSKIAEIFGYKIIPPSYIKNIDYDFILITVERKNIVLNYLINKLNIDKNKIIEI